MKNGRPEQILQRCVFDHLRLRGQPGAFFFHVPNGGYRTPIEAKIMKGLGVRAGVPDLLVIYQGQVYGLELKAPNGRTTPQQNCALADMEAAGAHTAVAIGIDQALATLEGWGLLRGKAFLAGQPMERPAKSPGCPADELKPQSPTLPA